jgi:predicted  nucleic acid-binding Zn-ribbon protein
MTTEWNEVLEKLLELQGLDLKIARLNQTLTRAPAEVKTRAAAVVAIDGQTGQFTQRVKLLKAQIMLRENERKTHLAKIEKLKEQASEVRSNKEFVAFRSEISNSQSDLDRIDNEVLKIMDVVEQAEAKVAEFDEQRSHEQGASDKAQAEIDEKLSDVRAQRDGFLKDRPAILAGIPKEQFLLYEKVHLARGRGMASLEGSYCSSCGEGQTRNDVYAVQNRTRLVACSSCSRILYQL